MSRTESSGDLVVIHPLDPGDASAIIPMRNAARTQKGAPWRIDARKLGPHRTPQPGRFQRPDLDQLAQRSAPVSILTSSAYSR